jgi:group II intron reverse transcriptase/maturase
VTQALGRVRQAARQRKKEKFTALLHHITLDTLRVAYYALKRKAAPGVDGVTWEDYEADLEPRLADLRGRVHRGAYRPQPSRRTYIPKADGKHRPLAIAALEDKIVQGATVMVLNAIYEEEFLGLSYGFRPGRGPHDALDALVVGITSRKVSWILDADIQNFFGSVSREWLVRFLELRIGDKRIIRLIQKWLRAGILEDGVVTVDDRGTGQGSVISPLLANIYLHYCFDLWAARWRRREATGDMIVVRYADDLVAGFEHEDDARRFLDAMRTRFAAFALALHPEKTFICGNSRGGRFLVHRKTRRDRMQAKLKEVKEQLRRRRHQPIPQQGKWLRQVVTGHFVYYAVPTNSRALSAFRQHVTDLWRRTLRRRSQRDGTTWDRMAKLADDWLPKPHIVHPWPSQRFAVTHPR